VAVKSEIASLSYLFCCGELEVEKRFGKLVGPSLSSKAGLTGSAK